MGKTELSCPTCGSLLVDRVCPRCDRKPRARKAKKKKRKQTLVLGTPHEEAPRSRDAIIPEELLARTEEPSRTTKRPSKRPSARPSKRPSKRPSQRTLGPGRGGKQGTLLLSNPDDEEASVGEHDGFAPSSPSGGGRGRYNLADQLAQADEGVPRLSRLSEWRATLAGVEPGRTTIMELTVIAESVVAGTDRRLPRKGIGRQLLVSTIAGLLLVLLAIAGLVFGAVRWVLLPALFVPIFALVVYGTLKLLPRLAARVGDRALPGGVPVWVGGGLTMMAVIAGFLTWGTSEATARVAVVVFPELAPPELRDEEDDELEERKKLADADMKKGKESRVRPGVLYVPPAFSSDDGAFDLVLHFHGYPPLVEDSINESKINALVHISNLGLGGRPYKAAFGVPDSFDKLITGIEKEAESLGLTGARVRRVAIATWSAGYGALFQILKDPERDTPIDAVLAMDGLHGSFVGGAREVQPESVEPYVALAKQAVEGQRLFVITHSAITTAEYPSSTESADAILSPLNLDRRSADPASSPPPVSFTTAVTAFPANGKKWLTAKSEVHEGEFHVYGYTGNTPEDHIAHLAQMSVTVLPHLERRWR